MAGTMLINGMKLKQLRDQHALSQEGLEYACSQIKGCSVSIATIKRAELGTPLSRRTVARLAKFFAVPIEELLANDSEKVAAMPAFTVEKTESIILWLRAGSKDILIEIEKQTGKFKPLFTQRLGNTLVIALPCQFKEKKLYLALQNILLALSLDSNSQFSALITIKALTKSSNNQWRLGDHHINMLSELAIQIQSSSIVVSDLLCEASKRYFLYQNAEQISGYQTLVQHSEPLSNCTVGRDHEIQLFRYAIDRIKHKQESYFLTINGVEGMGKSHMLNVLTEMAKTQGWLTIKLDFELSSIPSELLVKQLYRALQTTKNREKHGECSPIDDDSLLLLENIVNIRRESGPVILALDNFHQIDQTTLKDLRNLMESILDKTILLAVSYLPSDDTNRYIEELRYLRLPEINMALAPLTDKDMQSFSRKGVVISEDTRLSYIEISAGNPYYYQQLSYYGHEYKIPSTIRLHLQNKIDCLAPLSRQIIVLISLNTNKLALDDINSIVSSASSTIEELVGMKWIRVSHDKIVTICQPFLREVILADISHQDKCNIYLSLAKQINVNASTYNLNAQLSLADYYSKGEAWYEAAQSFLNCSQYYLEKGEYPQAQYHINLSLESQQKTTELPLKNGLLLDIRLSLAAIVRATHGWVSHSTVAAYQNCIALAKRQQCAKRHCISLSGLWVTQLMAMEFELSEVTANEILSLAEKSQELSSKALAYSCLANSQYWLAKHHQAVNNAKLSFQCSKEVDNKANYAAIGINPLALAGCFGSLSATLLCQDEDVIYFQNYNQDKDIIGEVFSYAIILQGEVWVNYHTRNFEQVISLSDQLLSLAESHNFPFYKGVAMLFKGWAQFFVPNQDEAQSLMLVEDGFNHWLASSGDQIAHSLYSLIKAELYINVSRQNEAMSLLENGIEIALQKNEACYLAPMYAMLASLKKDGFHYMKLAKSIANDQGACLFLREFIIN